MSIRIVKSLRSGVVLVLMLIAGSAILTGQARTRSSRQAVISVTGMSCETMCAPALQKRLAKLPDVKDVAVSAKDGRAVVNFTSTPKLTDKEIEQAVADAGFTATKIEWRRGRR